MIPPWLNVILNSILDFLAANGVPLEPALAVVVGIGLAFGFVFKR